MSATSDNDVKRLSDNQLIAAILGKDPQDRDQKRVVKDVLMAIQTKKTYIRDEDLIAIEGIDQQGTLKIMACFEITRRYNPIPDPTTRITRPEDILPLIANIRDKMQEHFVVITINGAGEILGNRIVTIGLLNHSLVHPREVYADAITDRAASIFCAHNHPSGSLEPSAQDIAITTQLKEAGSILGIQLIDHLIVTKTGHLSMRERGLV
jgi:DNA repair protein RadC